VFIMNPTKINKMKKLLLLLCLLPIMAIAQNFLSFGGAIVAPKTDTGNETGASLSASFNHIIGPVVIQPVMAITMMSGIDNERRRERQYSYNVEMASIGINLLSTGRFYGVIGLHYNANTLSNQFKLVPNQFDRTSRNNLFFSEYVGIGYRTSVNIEFGIMYANTNYMEGYWPITSKHNDMYLQLKVSYDIPLHSKCNCERRNYY